MKRVGILMALIALCGAMVLSDPAEAYRGYRGGVRLPPGRTTVTAIRILATVTAIRILATVTTTLTTLTGVDA
jgi:hypothetical protein